VGGRSSTGSLTESARATTRRRLRRVAQCRP
jgi:hypothetical protein